MADFYDFDGNVISLDQWIELYEGTRHLGRDEVGDLLISTVWLGINHRFGRGRPLIFETMVFNVKDDLFEEVPDFTCRYSTKEQAIEGHREALRGAIRLAAR